MELPQQKQSKLIAYVGMNSRQTTFTAIQGIIGNAANANDGITALGKLESELKRRMASLPDYLLDPDDRDWCEDHQRQKPCRICADQAKVDWMESQKEWIDEDYGS